MAKRFYWLKLKENFFEDDTIKWIEEQDNGKEYVLFYLKLCLKSLKTDGNMIRHVGDMIIPYDKKALSVLTNTDVDTVVVAMELFKKIGLIEVLDSGAIYLKQINEMVGTETDKAELMRKKRALDGNIVTQLLPECYTEKEKEKEKEFRDKRESIELEGEKEKKGINPVVVLSPFEQALNDFKEMRKKIKSPMTDKAVDMLVRKLSKMAYDESEQIEILEQSIMNGWKSIYPLKNDDGGKKGSGNKNVQNGFDLYEKYRRLEDEESGNGQGYDHHSG